MEFIISELQTEYSFEGQVIKRLKEVLNEIDGFCFYNHPSSEIDDASYDEHSFLILSPYWGVLILDAFPYDINKITEEEIKQILKYGEAKIYKIYSKILGNGKLRDCEDERLKIENIIYNLFFPYVNEGQVSYLTPDLTNKIIWNDTISSNIDRLKAKFDKLIDRSIWNTLINEISGISQVVKKRFKCVWQYKNT
ncbi:hypothetical protein [Carboxydothermus pertinax]|uniref:Uncharacterized protein n=1 Tax=Carboxydothermus pertinax TaxID=870242 RepID=A0A1L8CWK1_9THEO|nr:hypothetical protein [Carboxydothermus pertinax]GAV23292.1 hypothetical protein cpu_18020 [Carboxydothermus pertinax]